MTDSRGEEDRDSRRVALHFIPYDMRRDEREEATFIRPLAHARHSFVTLGLSRSRLWIRPADLRGPPPRLTRLNPDVLRVSIFTTLRRSD